MPQSKTLNTWNRLSGTAAGRWLFSRAVCIKAPYFMSIRPVMDELEPGRAVARLKKRRRVQNHIGTVHAIACANLCEFVAGLLAEATTPVGMRWIPKGMTIDYLAKAGTSLRAVGQMPDVTQDENQDVVVSVDVFDREGTIVVHADITMYLSVRPAK
ncbi:MAG: hotdog fold domain-containing protein [Woeseiaceae bacterium]|nr:hotdog fold domain-containing protein [Woeseiaceae bacterium]